jgi:hypothetical protein
MDDLAKPPDNESLESSPQSGGVIMPTDSGSTGESLESSNDSAPKTGGPTQPAGSGKSRRFSLRSILNHLSIYLFAFLLLIVVGVIIAVAAYLKNSHQNPGSNNSIATQNLSAQALQQLANNGTTIGDAEHTLNIQSNSVFAGAVLVRGSLDVAGTVKMGGSLGISGLSVSGSSSFGQLQAKGISVANNLGVRGQLSAASLTVAGSGSFNGAITAPSVTTGSLQLSGNLGITHHINTGGPVPGRSNGGALGSGGTSSVSGSDTAGSISIHTGSNPVAGCFITVSFVNTFGNTPHVIVTPVGSAAAGLRYYINRTSSNFSVCTTTAAPSGSAFGFDYIVLG